MGRILDFRAAGAPSKTPAPSLWPVGSFTLFYLAASTAGAFLRGNLEFLFYIAVMPAVIALVWAVHRRVALTSGALWCLSLWGLAHMAGGLLEVPAGWPTHGSSRVLYSLWLIPGYLKYDQVVHAYGFGATTWVSWQGLRAILAREGRSPRPTVGMMVLCWAAGLGFGALNEVLEFAATLLVPETNVGGYLNTGWDLVANAVGATAVVVLIWLGGLMDSRR